MQNSKNESQGINKLNLVLAVIIAFAAWIYVVYNINPTVTKTYNDVPVKVINTGDLSKRDLAVSKLENETISISIQARRSIINRMKKSDLEAKVDVSNAGKGENSLAVTVLTPAAVSVKSQSINSNNVTVENLEKKKVAAIATYKDGQKGEPSVKKQGEKEVEIKGAESLVKEVSYVKLELNSENITDKPKEISTRTVPVNSGGKVIKYIKCNPSRVSVTAFKGHIKNVRLKLNIKDDGSDILQRTYTAPTNINIKGSKSDLKNITEISTQEIDLSGIDKSTELNLKYDLPDGISIASDSMNFKLRVRVAYKSKKTVSIAAGAIKINNVTAGLTAQAANGVDITVSGSAEELAKISSDSFSVSVDVSGLTAGQHTVQATLINNSGLKNVTLGSSQITVNIQ